MSIGAAYVRVSTEDQLEFSPASQIKKIKEYANQHNILLPEEYIFIDEGISGRKAEKRPDFMRMIGIAKVKPRPFEVILVWKFSRFARNREDSILYKSMLRKECNIDVISISEQLADDPTSILVEALLEAMDEYYSINLSQEVKRGMCEKFSQGGVISVPPLGYKMGEKNFELDSDAAPIITMIYQNFLDGMSIWQITRKLNELGIRTARGNKFENRTVEYILTNPTYTGKLRKRENAKYSDRLYKCENTIIVEGKHKAIISEEIYDAVQQKFMLTKENSDLRKKKFSTYSDFMLHGVVYCSNCGSVLTQISKGKALQCYKYSKGQCNESHYVSIEKLNSVVLNLLEHDLGNNYIEIAGPKPEKYPIEILNVLVKKTKIRMRRSTEAYESGIYSLEEYKESKEKLTMQIETLESKIKNRSINKVSRFFKGNFYELIKMLKDSDINENIKNNILHCIIDKIVFFRRDNSVQLYYKL